MFPGSTLSDHCLRYENIPQIKLIVVLGELGGQDEYSLVCFSLKGSLCPHCKTAAHTPGSNMEQVVLPTACHMQQNVSSNLKHCLDSPWICLSRSSRTEL